MITFLQWLEGLELDMSPSFADEKQRRILNLDKTTKCLKSKLEALGIKVKFKLVSRNDRAERERSGIYDGLQGFLEKSPDSLTIVRSDSLQHPLTCWMMLHQVGHAMEKSMNGSNNYKMVDSLIRKWWRIYHEYTVRESNFDWLKNYQPANPNDDDDDWRPPAVTAVKPAAPAPVVTPPKPVVPPVNFGDSEHRKLFKQQQAPGKYEYDAGSSQTMAHAMISKFLAMKSARDTWEGFRKDFHNGHTAWSSVVQFSGGRARFSGYDELLNELVAEYIWHGKIRFVNDPEDPFIKEQPNYIPDMFKKIGQLIQEGLEKMKGEAVAID